jgi:hypothetical protein
MAESNLPPEPILHARYELRDLSPKHVAIFGGSLAGIIVLVLLVARFLIVHYYNVQQKARPPLSPLSFNQPPMPEPRLIVTPGQGFETLRKQENDVLGSYAWVDKDQGIARIPIARAMEILTQKSLPARTQKSAQPDGKSSVSEPQRQNQTQRQKSMGERR